MKEYTDKHALIEKINDTGIYVGFDLPFEKIFRGDINLDDFSAVFQNAIEKYRKTIISIIKSQPAVTQADIETIAYGRGERAFAEKLKEKWQKAIDNPDIALECKKCAVWRIRELDELLKEMGVL